MTKISLIGVSPASVSFALTTKNLTPKPIISAYSSDSKIFDQIKHLEAIYCDAIGVEYMYIRKPEEIKWIQDWININDNHPTYNVDEKKHILKKLNQAVSFETFLHSKYVGQKRFSVEGNESLIPGLDTLMEKAAQNGVKQFVVGMAHRGRLNVLANIFGKS